MIVIQSIFEEFFLLLIRKKTSFIYAFHWKFLIVLLVFVLFLYSFIPYKWDTMNRNWRILLVVVVFGWMTKCGMYDNIFIYSRFLFSFRKTGKHNQEFCFFRFFLSLPNICLKTAKVNKLTEFDGLEYKSCYK